MLEIRNVSFSIGELKILDRVTLSISQGETVGLIGPNGSGKTTLFNCVSGFNVPTQGAIVFNQRDITHIRPFKRAHLGLGRVFQNFGVFKEMTVVENIITAIEGRQSALATFAPWSAVYKANRARALDYLAEIGLAEKASQKAGSLSGGQMRLLEIVRTLAFGAELFLLDEPTAGVSPRMKDDIAALLARLQEMKKTVLVIEHDINFIQKFCDRILVLDLGRLILDDTPEKVRQNPLLQEIYFGNPGNTEESSL